MTVYRHCPVCRLEAEHNQRGVCLFCNPESRPTFASCDECGAQFERLATKATQKFCSERCRKNQWHRTASVEYHERRQQRHNARRAYVRALGGK